MKLGVVGIALGLALCSCTAPNGGPPQQYLITFKGMPGSYVLTIPPGTVLPTTDLTPYLTATTSGVTPQGYNRAKFDCTMIARNSAPVELGRGHTVAGAFVNGVFNAIDAGSQQQDIYNQCIQAYAPL